MRDRGFNGVIVAVTGNAMPDEIHNFRTEGADLVVTSKYSILSTCFVNLLLLQPIYFTS